MRLKFGHLCDFAAIDNGGKPIIFGAFEVMFGNTASRDPVGMPVVSLITPRFYLMLGVEASTAEGPVHDLVARLLDADGEEKGAVTMMGARFSTRIEGSALTAYIAHMMEGIELPFGDYVFEIGVLRQGDGGPTVERFGEVPFHAIGMQLTATPP